MREMNRMLMLMVAAGTVVAAVGAAADACRTRFSVERNPVDVLPKEY